ncbi:MAG: hypothetical protein QY307_00240 [Acidimicrobiia bacterium]|nr:MAG: hypothetical protein QY307_00240 [Acidimicrobiia bacterium]
MSSPARERIPSFVSRSRLAQGLPERVTDPATLACVAALLQTAARVREPEGKPACAGAATAS